MTAIAASASAETRSWRHWIAYGVFIVLTPITLALGIFLFTGWIYNHACQWSAAWNTTIPAGDPIELGQGHKLYFEYPTTLPADLEDITVRTVITGERPDAAMTATLWVTLPAGTTASIANIPQGQTFELPVRLPSGEISHVTTFEIRNSRTLHHCRAWHAASINITTPGSKVALPLDVECETSARFRSLYTYAIAENSPLMLIAGSILSLLSFLATQWLSEKDKYQREQAEKQVQERLRVLRVIRDQLDNQLPTALRDYCGLQRQSPDQQKPIAPQADRSWENDRVKDELQTLLLHIAHKPWLLSLLTDGLQAARQKQWERVKAIHADIQTITDDLKKPRGNNSQVIQNADFPDSQILQKLIDLHAYSSTLTASSTADQVSQLVTALDFLIQRFHQMREQTSPTHQLPLALFLDVLAAEIEPLLGNQPCLDLLVKQLDADPPETRKVVLRRAVTSARFKEISDPAVKAHFEKLEIGLVQQTDWPPLWPTYATASGDQPQQQPQVSDLAQTGTTGSDQPPKPQLWPQFSDLAETDLFLSKCFIEPVGYDQICAEELLLLYGEHGSGLTAVALNLTAHMRSDKAFVKDCLPLYLRVAPKTCSRLEDILLYCLGLELSRFCVRNPQQVSLAAPPNQTALSALALAACGGAEGLKRYWRLVDPGSADRLASTEALHALGAASPANAPLPGAETLWQMISYARPFPFQRLMLLIDLQVPACSDQGIHRLAGDLIRLVTDLERHGVMVKLFAATEVGAYFQTINRIPTFRLSWTTDQLAAMLDKRFGGPIFASTVPNGMQRLAEAACGSPRRLMRLGRALVQKAIEMKVETVDNDLLKYIIQAADAGATIH